MKKVFVNLVAIMAVTTSMSAQNSDTLRRVTTISETTKVSDLSGGRVASVITKQTSGELGKNLSEFWVRGIGTFGTGDSALVLIDGVEGDLNSFRPEDIQSFSILKDASAVAVYGTRGANGVVLVNTKSGRKNLIEPETNSAIVETEIPSVDATKASDLLGGRVAGVITKQTSGEPGKNLSEFWVRGIGTFGTGGNALVLIDGVEGDLNSLNPEDIQSFSILKDASAIAVYGTRGANGVVLVNTKSGRKNLIEPETNSAITEPEIPSVDLVTAQIEHADTYASEIETEIVDNGTEDFFPDLKIYPNPFSGMLRLAGAEGSTLQVISADGVVIHTQKLISSDEIIRLEHLRIGVYYFCVDNGKQTKTVKVVKNN